MRRRKRRNRAILAGTGVILVLSILFFTVGHGACRVLALVSDLGSGGADSTLALSEISENNAIGKLIRRIKYHDYLEIINGVSQRDLPHISEDLDYYPLDEETSKTVDYEGRTYWKQEDISSDTLLSELLVEADEAGSEGFYAIEGVSAEFAIAEKRTAGKIIRYFNREYGENLTLEEYLKGLGIAELYVDLQTANQALEIFYADFPMEYLIENVGEGAARISEDNEIMEDASVTGLRVVWKDVMGQMGEMWFWNNGCVSIAYSSARSIYTHFYAYYDLNDEKLSIGTDLIKYSRENCAMGGV